MTIAAVEVERRSLPLHRPFVTALRRATTIETVVVRVTDSASRVGYGEAPQVWPVTGDGVTAAARLAAAAGCDVVPDLDGAWWLATPDGVSHADGQVWTL